MPDPKPPQRDPRLRLIEYALPGQWKALVGRTDADNDYLSLKVAQPDDWWFHVRGVPGSHVVLQGPPGAEPDRDTRKRAAAIAAYHSKARSAGFVSVSCTRARYVAKPRNAKAGAVQIRKEVVLKVRPGWARRQQRTANSFIGAFPGSWLMCVVKEADKFTIRFEAPGIAFQIAPN